jgi:uncharacterized membrane protein
VTEAATPKRAARTAALLVFALLLIFAAIFVNADSAALPAMVAVHFDAAGRAGAFAPRGQYQIAVLLAALALPVALVGIMVFAYSRATDLKLPNRDYWLAPQRLERTRAFLITHSIWLGSLMVALTCFVHWLILDANLRRPPELSNSLFALGLGVFTACMAIWVATLMIAFRRKRSD